MSGPGPQPVVAGPVQTLTTTLSAAQILTLNTIPVEVVPAPSVGQMILVQNLLAQLNAGANPYANVALKAGYSTSSPSVNNGLTNFFNQVVDTDFRTAPKDFVYARSVVDGSSIVVFTADPTVDSTGPIATTSLNAGGADYAPGDTGTINGDVGDAAYVIDTVSGGGAVLTFHLTNNGTGYSAPSVAFTGTGGGQPGIGTGFKINILTVTAPPQGNGTVDVTVFYSVVDLA